MKLSIKLQASRISTQNSSEIVESETKNTGFDREIPKEKYTLRESVQTRSFFWSVYSCIQTEYGDLNSKSPHSVRIQDNTDQKKLHIWTLFTQ